MNVGRKQTWTVLGWLALLAWTAYAASAMFAAAGRTDRAVADEQTCEQLAAAIVRLRAGPRFAGLDADSPETITNRVVESAKVVGLRVESLSLRIQPQSTQRLGDSPYMLRPTRLELRGATLLQLAQLAQRMVAGSLGTTVRDLRLTPDRPDDASAGHKETWAAELVLTQLLFSPISP